MKHTRKFASLATAAVLAACAVVPVMSALPASAAATAGSITFSGATAGTHEYTAYQIFSGTAEDNGMNPSTGAKLENINWAFSDTDAESFLTDLKADTTLGDDFKDCDSAASVAQVLASYTNNGDKAKAFAAFAVTQAKKLTSTQSFTSSDNSAIEIDADGYYVIEETGLTPDATVGGAKTAYLLGVYDASAGAEVVVKSALPTVDKQVLDEVDDAEAGATDGWGESADRAINESFQFKLTATLAADAAYADYKEYTVTFNDTMSTGVTFESIASVKVNGEDVTAGGYTSTATKDQKGGDWKLTIADLKTVVDDLSQGATVEVIYNAHLNEDAVLSKESGEDVNTNNNKVSLTYSNNPYANGEGDKSTTSEDYVWVFTYEVDNTKYKDEAKTGNELAGAEFTLYNSTGDTEIGLIYDSGKGAYRPTADGETATAMVSADNTGKFNIIGLDAGTYVLKETKTPKGYTTVENVTIVISATHKENTAGTAANLTLTNDSNMKNDVVNKSGSTLPSTGGIGTTIFYVAGGVLVVGAGVLLITKKRAKDVD